MKNTRQLLHALRLSTLLSAVLLLGLGCIESDAYAPPPPPTPEPPPAKSIKLGLLLDTSNSMDGLIDQAKSQLWKMVNELAKAKCDGADPEITIALYEYGNDNLSAREGYIRLVTPLTNDLDQISEDLFSLRTNGGSEFCGHVIQSALNQLDWGGSDEDLKLLFIAGNEPFTQGAVSYVKECQRAAEKGISINTIFCGNFNEGINTSWKHGADLTGGHYMSIEHNRQTVYIESPYDARIVELNSRLNKTYVPYGRYGHAKKEKQMVQDDNASSYGAGNAVQRTLSKGSKVYKNSSWDMVDASDDAGFDMEEVEEAYLPEEMKDMTVEERTEYVETKKKERDAVKREIAQLNVKRTEYVNSQKIEQDEHSLDQAMLTAIRQQATHKNFVFE